MAERLIVRNFGPIQEADIEIKDLTVFVGPQATGESIAAQLLYLMCGFETLANRSLGEYLDERQHALQVKDAPVPYLRDPTLESAIKAMEWWFGNDVSVYASPKTTLCWNPESPGVDTDYGISWEDKGPILSQLLAEKLGLAQDRNCFWQQVVIGRDQHIPTLAQVVGQGFGAGQARSVTGIERNGPDISIRDSHSA